jgi:hypothetical protein
VAFPVPQPTSRTRDESVNAANSHTSAGQTLRFEVKILSR